MVNKHKQQTVSWIFPCFTNSYDPAPFRQEIPLHQEQLRPVLRPGAAERLRVARQSYAMETAIDPNGELAQAVNHQY